jgi:hypothetical protein
MEAPVWIKQRGVARARIALLDPKPVAVNR